MIIYSFTQVLLGKESRDSAGINAIRMKEEEDRRRNEVEEALLA